MDADDLDLSAPRRVRLGAIGLVALLHLLVVLGLIRAFAPGIAAKAVNAVVSTFTVTVTTPPPKPDPAEKPKPAGAAADAGRKADARAVQAPKPKVPLAKTPAPKAASTGNADSSGASARGNGTGAGGSGNGTGSGNGGNGDGGGAVTKAVHIAGQISNAGDFPVPPGGREARIGKSVILALTVSPNGRATACRIYRSSSFADTDAAACRLAMNNLRFRPATNAAGEPVTSTFYWQQKFFF